MSPSPIARREPPGQWNNLDHGMEFSSRPNYMKTNSWMRLSKNLLRYHENHPEVVVYKPFLGPKAPGEEKGKEKDVMQDSEAFGESWLCLKCFVWTWE